MVAEGEGELDTVATGADMAHQEEEAEEEEAEEAEEAEVEEAEANDEEAAPGVHAGKDEFDEEELDRDMEMLQQACLPVSGAPLPPSNEPPKDADEYLRQVQWERMHLQEVVSVEVEEKPPRRRRRQGADRTASLLAQFDAPEVPQELSFCEEWADDVSEAFQQMRLRCKETRRMVAVPAGGADAGEGSLAASAWQERCAEERPSTAFLAAQDFVSINHLIVTIVDAMAEVQDAVGDGSGDCAGGETAEGPLASHSERLEQLAEWAFAALAFVDVPLVDEIQFQLQRLRRTCQRLILAEHAGSRLSSDGQDGDVVHGSPFRAKANLLLVIVTRVFGQR